jgi:class 3 adenylate cyclase
VGEFPTGTVTFLFSDLEGSTRLWEEHAEAMKDELARHDQILRDAIEVHGGHTVEDVPSHWLMSALSCLDSLADEVTPNEVLQTIDEATLEVFWRDWPQINAWAASPRQRLNEDRAAPATPPQDPNLDEVGESG